MDSQTKQLQDFWDQLEQVLEQLRDAEAEELPEQSERLLHAYRKRLREIDDNLTLNFEQKGETGPMELVFGCDGYPESIHNVLSLVNSAPKLTGIEVKAFNERLDPVPGTINMAGEICEIHEYWFSLRLISGHLELAIYLQDAPNILDIDPRVEAVMIWLDALIGEYEIMTKIWALDWFSLPVDPLDYGLKPLAELREEFDAIKPEIKPIGIQLH